MTTTAPEAGHDPVALPTADSWPVAAAMLYFGGLDSAGGPITEAAPEEWARHLRIIRRQGFTEVDPTDTWVRVGDLPKERLAEFSAVLADVGLTVPAISTSRRSVVDPERGEEYLAYSHRLLDNAAELGVPMVSFGFFQALTPAQQQALWFWLVDGWHDDESDEARRHAAGLIRELAEHARSNGQQITLEMYEDTYVGTADGAIRFLAEVDHEACGLNPDIGNLVRLHRPLEPVPQMFDKLLPYANYWHVKNYLRDEDPDTGQVMTFPVPMEYGLIDYRAAIAQAVRVGFRGAFLCEHYGSDSVSVMGRNRAYVREILRDVLADEEASRT
jgi:sugar phosphate isomerase/epimerase